MVWGKSEFMKKLIVANWKCNPATQTEAERLFDSIKKGLKDIKKTKGVRDIEIVICPPYPYLYTGNLKIEARNLKLGAQNCFWKEKGAYTGEVSPKMLKSLGVTYVIVGHSERRKYFKEINQMINQKLLAALESGLKPILCIGEKEEEDISLVIKNQLIKGLKGINRAKIRDLIIAYEPVWAIGTGNPCQIDDALKANLFIRQTLTKLYNRKLAEETRILYGGSVNSKRAQNYILEAGMNGLLIGGASWDAEEFVNIVKQIVEL